MLFFSLESLSRTASWVGVTIASPEPIQTRGHRRNISSSSTASTASDASLVTPISAITGPRNDAVVIAEDQEDHEHLLPPQHAEVSGINRFRSISDPLAATFKSVFQRSTATSLPESVMWTQPGLLDGTKLETMLKRRSIRGGTASFKMLPGSYIGYNRLGDVLECLAATSPMIKEIVLYSQIYTLEELNALKPTISKFLNLRDLYILDASDDPPTETRALHTLVTEWATACPSVQRIRFSNGKMWEMDADEGGAGPKRISASWVEVVTEQEHNRAAY